MFSVILFLICFCLASIAMYEPKSESSTTVDSFDQFYNAVKEVFAPESEVVIAEPSQPLSPAQTDSYHQAESIINPVLSTSIAQDFVNPTKPTSQFTIRQLRNHVRQQNLQAAIKKQLGKSVNHCRKEELMSVLFA